MGITYQKKLFSMGESLFKAVNAKNCKNYFFKGIPSYFFLFLKKIVHDPTRNKSYYLIV